MESETEAERSVRERGNINEVKENEIQTERGRWSETEKECKKKNAVVLLMCCRKEGKWCLMEGVRGTLQGRFLSEWYKKNPKVL